LIQNKNFALILSWESK